MPILTNVLGFFDASTLTIASGVVTVTQTMHVIAAESATSDDLDTINISADVPTASGSTVIRSYILLRADSGDTITVKHGTGNITLGSGADYVLSGSKTLQLLYTGSAWVDLQSSSAAAGIGGSTGATDNAILRADGVGGSTAQNSGVTIDDSDNVSGVTNLALDSIQFTAATELTIATGAVTITQSVHTIDTEGDAASDDLDTISGGAAGDIIYIRAANDARSVVVKNGTGNILTYASSDITLDEDHQVISLYYNGTNWLQVGGSGGGAGASALNDLTDVSTAGVTTNDVLTYNGSSWEPASPLGAGAGGKIRRVGTIIHQETLGSTGVFSVSGISGAYDTLEIRAKIRGSVSAAADNVYLYYNSDTTNGNYRYQSLSAVTTTLAGASADFPYIGTIVASTGTADNFSSVTITIENYASTSIHKTAHAFSSARASATDTREYYISHWWESTSAITAFDLRPDGYATDQFLTGSTITVIGWVDEQIGGLDYATDNVTNPPTDAELDSAFGTPASVGAGYSAILDDNGAGTAVYFVTSDGTNWWYSAMTKAV